MFSMSTTPVIRHFAEFPGKFPVMQVSGTGTGSPMISVSEPFSLDDLGIWRMAKLAVR
jgi:hypothetical protein